MSFRQIRERDSSGVLVKAGYVWLEQRDISFIPFLLGMGLSGLGSIVGLLALGSHRPQDGALLLLICVPVFIGCWIGMRKLGSYERSVLFDSQGAIITPSGLPDYPNLRQFPSPHSSIASIEMRKDGAHHTVLALERGGTEFRIGQKMPDNHARQVTVQLNMALSEMRASIGGAQKAKAANVVID